MSIAGLKEIPMFEKNEDDRDLPLTEQRNPASFEIDRLATEDLCRLINRQDAQTPLAVAEAIPQIADAVDHMTSTLSKGHRIFYMGAGTSGRLGVLDASELLPTFGLEPGRVVALIAGGDNALRNSIEAAEDSAEQGKSALQQHNFCADDLVVGIAASGGTPYVIGGMQYAASLDAKSVAIVCAPNSRMVEIADIAIVVAPGPEVVTGSTRMKAGTAQKMTLNMLSTATMIKLGKVYGNLMVDVQPTNAKLQRRAIRIVQEATGATPEEATSLVERSGANVKVAVVMGLLNCGAAEARTRLDANAGQVRLALSA